MVALIPHALIMPQYLAAARRAFSPWCSVVALSTPFPGLSGVCFYLLMSGLFNHPVPRVQDLKWEQRKVLAACLCIQANYVLNRHLCCPLTCCSKLMGTGTFRNRVSQWAADFRVSISSGEQWSSGGQCRLISFLSASACPSETILVGRRYYCNWHFIATG